MKKPLFVILFATLILVVTLSGCGTKKGQLGGKIYDDTTKELITGSVVVTLTGASSITVTNGQYQFTDVSIGDKTLTAQAEGYKTYTASVKIEAGKTITKDIYLVEEVTVPPDPTDPTPGEKGTYTVGGVVFDMRYAPSGSFISDDNVISEDEKLPGPVDVTNPFWIAETEVTYELWHKVYTWATTDGHGYTFANPGREGHDGTIGAAPTSASQEPVTTVSWRDALVWCNALTEYYNAQSGMSLSCVYKSGGNPIRDATAGAACDAVVPDSGAKGFRLPTSGEWQLAARYQDGSVWTPGDHVSGDTSGPCYSTDPEAVLSTVFGDYAWYSGCGSTKPVGQKSANALEVRDMTGNVYEWCFDKHPSYTTRRICRGGSWGGVASYLRIGKITFGTPDYTYSGWGFRFVRTQ